MMRQVPTCRRRSRSSWLFATLIATTCALAQSAPFAAAAPAPSPVPAPSRPAPLEWRAIVLKGAEMPQLEGSQESHLEVLAIHGGHAAPIPFQVDEVLPDGEYALPDGPHPVLDDSPGILDRDDEVAMMLSDLGESANTVEREKLPAGALQIEAADPVTGEHRYAYIASVASPRRSPVSYMKYNPALGRIDGAGYQMTFMSDFPVGLALRSADGTLSPNLIRDTQVRVSARVLMFFRLHFGAHGVRNRVLAWDAGPIRVIRRVSHSVKLILGIQSPWVVSSEVFYRDYTEDSFVARVVWVPRVLFGDVRVRTWLDFVGLDGFNLSWSEMDGAPLAIGEADANTIAQLQRDPPPTRWLALRGDGKTIVQTFMPSPDLDVVRPRLYYCDGPAASGASYECDDATLRIGYLMTGWQDLSSGTHRLESLLIVLPADADPHQINRQLATPPSVAVTALKAR